MRKKSDFILGKPLIPNTGVRSWYSKELDSLVKNERAQKKEKADGVLSLIPPSEGIGKWYKRELRALSVEMSRKTISNLISVYRRENSQIKALYAQAADSAEVLKAELERLNKEFYAVFTGKAESLAKGFVERQSDYASISVKGSLKAFGTKI